MNMFTIGSATTVSTERERLILWSLFHRQTELVFSCFCPFNLEQSFICHLLVWITASRPIRPSEEDADDLLSLKWQTSLSPTALKPELDSQKCGVSAQWATQNDQDWKSCGLLPGCLPRLLKSLTTSYSTSGSIVLCTTTGYLLPGQSSCVLRRDICFRVDRFVYFDGISASGSIVLCTTTGYLLPGQSLCVLWRDICFRVNRFVYYDGIAASGSTVLCTLTEYQLSGQSFCVLRRDTCFRST